jgi:hypothetical protein
LETLKNKPKFFLPPNIEQLLSSKGSREYYNQTIQFDKNETSEENILTLLKLIEKYKELEQEVFKI